MFDKKTGRGMRRTIIFIVIVSLAIFLYRCGTLDVDGGPCGIAVDSSNNVYVTYPSNGVIKKFSSAGVLQIAWSSRIPSWSKGSGPSGIAVWPGGAYVCVTDLANGLVQVYTSAGAYYSQYAQGAFFNNPEGIAVDSGGDMYICDYGNNRVYIFINGGGTSQWSNAGTGNGQFQGPLGIAVDSTDNVYVCDYRNNRIQKFNSSGVYQTQWGSKGSGNGQFEGPMGVAVDSANSFVYVADTFNNRVQKFDLSGVYQGQWGSKGSGAGQFERPQGIAVDSAGNVYVADIRNFRIQKFNLSGVFLTMWQ